MSMLFTCVCLLQMFLSSTRAVDPCVDATVEAWTSQKDLFESPGNKLQQRQFWRIVTSYQDQAKAVKYENAYLVNKTLITIRTRYNEDGNIIDLVGNIYTQEDTAKYLLDMHQTKKYYMQCTQNLVACYSCDGTGEGFKYTILAPWVLLEYQVANQREYCKARIWSMDNNATFIDERHPYF